MQKQYNQIPNSWVFNFLLYVIASRHESTAPLMDFNVDFMQIHINLTDNKCLMSRCDGFAQDNHLFLHTLSGRNLIIYMRVIWFMNQHSTCYADGYK
jgi:hypothetical protein